MWQFAVSIDIVLRWYVLLYEKCVLLVSWLFVVVPLLEGYFSFSHDWLQKCLTSFYSIATHAHAHNKSQYRTPTLNCQEFTTVYNCKENDDMLPAKTSTSGGCWLDGKLVGVPTYQPTEEPTTPLYVTFYLKSVIISCVCLRGFIDLTRPLRLSVAQHIFFQPYNSGACKFIQKKMSLIVVFLFPLTHTSP